MKIDVRGEYKEIDQESLQAHRLLVMCLFLATLIIGGLYLGVVLYYAMTGRGGGTIVTAVIVAGAGGGFVSSLRRLYSFEDIFPRREYLQLFRKLNLYVVAYSFVPPVVGMIAAVVLYLVFAAGLLEGDLFPEFACPGSQNCTDFAGFVADWSPKDAAENAKAIVWGFIAGFSERFVPDILSRFGTETTSAQR